eukprot:maker-scaffold_6-snap-gene-16.24-mRNA-1 protein AED:0.00 eAED:0.00 QI:37/1/1/1/0/0/2/84/100
MKRFSNTIFRIKTQRLSTATPSTSSQTASPVNPISSQSISQPSKNTLRARASAFMWGLGISLSTGFYFLHEEISNNDSLVKSQILDIKHDIKNYRKNDEE